MTDTPREPAASDPEAATLAAFRARASTVDAQTAAQLQAARREAVRRQRIAERPAPARWALPSRWTYAATAGVLVLALGLGYQATRPLPEVDGGLPVPAVGLDELALVSELELLEDLDFLAWLDTVDSGAG